MNCYYAQFLPESNNIITVSFPDLPGCVTFGNGVEDALKQAMDALAGYLEVELDGGEPLPDPSSLEEAREKCASQDKRLGLATSREVFYQMVCVEPRIAAPESITIWIQRGLFGKIKALAKEKGVSISQLLSDAAREYVKRERG